MNPIRTRRCARTSRRRPLALATGILACATASHALEIPIDDTDWSVRFDNTLKLSTVYRLRDANPALADSFRQVPTGAPPPAPQTFPFAQAENFNAGDDNFRKPGFVSERVDLLSEFDAIYAKRFGLRVSGAAWYDQAYHKHSDAIDATNGQTPTDQFPGRTRQVAGGMAEVLDAFVFGGVDLGDGHMLTGRLGQHALQYGESLFFGDNAVAKAQGPVDIDKLLSSPNAQFKELIRPVPQLSANLQLSSTVSVGGYYQFRWEPDRLAPAGSYFSSVNIPWGSAQPEFVSLPASAGPLAGDYVLAAGANQEPRHSAQFGGQVKVRLQDTDLGFYAARFSDKDGQLYGNLDVANKADSRWYYLFPDAIKVYGVSVSQSLGDFNVSAEGSLRDNMPLRSQNILYAPGFGATPRVAKGRTAHLNVSTLASFGPNFLAAESGLVAEIAWNRVLKVDDPDTQLDAGRTRDASALQLIYTPTYRQVLPGLDLNVPLGVRYSLSGNSSVTAWDPKGSGNVSLGVAGTYLGDWQFTATYTKYVGKPVPFVDYSGLLRGGTAIYSHGNTLADRDYVSLSLRRSF